MTRFATPLLLALLAVAGPTQADERVFRFVGQVTYSTGFVPVGAKIEGRFSYDTSAKPGYVLGDANGPGFGAASYQVPSRMTATVNGRTIATASIVVNVTNNFGGNTEDSLSIYGTPASLDQTVLPEGNFGLFLASSTRRDRVLKDVSLPERINVKRFDGMNYGWLMLDGSASGTLLSFTIQRIKARDGDESDDD